MTFIVLFFFFSFFFYRKKSLKKKKAVSQVFIFTSLEIYSGRDRWVREKVLAREEYYLQQVLWKEEQVLNSAATQISSLQNEKYLFFKTHSTHIHFLSSVPPMRPIPSLLLSCSLSLSLRKCNPRIHTSRKTVRD